MITIPLKQSYTAIIDDVDKDLAEIKWHVSNNYVYRGRSREHGERALHRIIGERILGRKLKHGQLVDHVNRDPRDNRRSNLRIATNSQNMANKVLKPGKSGYRGVRQMPSGRWSAKISATHLGVYDTPELAYAAFCEAAKKRWGEFFSPDQ